MDRSTYDLARYRQNRREALGLLGGRCVICGTTESLEFDHIDRRLKQFEISQLLTGQKAERLESELAKCQLLCRNHHIRKTSEERIWHHGTLHGFQHKKCRCVACSAAGLAHLETRRSRNGQKPRAFADHGKYSTYFNHGCRCGPCRQAASVASKRWRDAKRK